MITYLYQFPYEGILITSGFIWIICSGVYATKQKGAVNLSWFMKSGLIILYVVLFLSLYFTLASCKPAKEGSFIILQLVPFHIIRDSSFISIVGNLLMLMSAPVLFYVNLGSVKKHL